MNIWEFSYNGLTFGANNQIGLLTIQGLGPPNTKFDVKQKIVTHGAFTFGGFYEERHIIFEGDILPTSGLGTDVEALVNSWRTAFAPQAADLLMQFQLPGVAQRSIWCKPMRRDVKYDTLSMLGLGHWTLELVAGDTTIYASDGTTPVFTG